MGLRPDEYFVAKAVEVVQSAADGGLAGASEALHELRSRATASSAGRPSAPDEGVKPDKGDGGASKASPPSILVITGDSGCIPSRF